MPDYSEFPTTPTAWQETQWQEARMDAARQLEKEDPPVPPRRKVDYVALVPGVLFSVLAIALMTGVDLPVTVFRDGGIVWAVLIVAGIALLARELRRTRGRR